MRLALAAVAALALAATACSVGAASEVEPADALERTEAADSFVYETKMDVAPGVVQRCEGAVDRENDRSRQSCKRDSLTVTVGGQSYARANAGWWWKLGVDQEVLKPGDLLELVSATTGSERIGEEEVRGESTVRWTLSVDCTQLRQFSCQGPTSSVDIWIDDDGLIRRLRLDEREGAVNLELFDFGAVEVESPPANRVVEVPGTPGPCQPGRAGPIGVRRAIAALRDRGFEVESLPFACGAGIATYLTNAPDDVLATRDVLIHDTGHLSCYLHTDEPAYAGVLTHGVGIQRDDVPGVLRDVANLACSLYVLGPQRRERIAALDAAMSELRG